MQMTEEQQLARIRARAQKYRNSEEITLLLSLLDQALQAPVLLPPNPNMGQALPPIPSDLLQGARTSRAKSGRRDRGDGPRQRSRGGSELRVDGASADATCRPDLDPVTSGKID